MSQRTVSKSGGVVLRTAAHLSPGRETGPASRHRLQDTRHENPLRPRSAAGSAAGGDDLGGAALSAYLIYQAHRLKLPKSAIARMIGNVAVEAALGAIPLAGDMFDLFWRANMRNARIMRRHTEHMETISTP